MGKRVTGSDAPGQLLIDCRFKSKLPAIEESTEPNSSVD